MLGFQFIVLSFAFDDSYSFSALCPVQLSADLAFLKIPLFVWDVHAIIYICTKKTLLTLIHNLLFARRWDGEEVPAGRAYIR